PDGFNDFYFDRWESMQGSSILPSLTSPIAQLNLTGSDTVIAYFVQHTVNVPVLDKNVFSANVYPTISNGLANIDFNLTQQEDITIKVNSISGRTIWSTTKSQLNLS
ncbi:MAG TPA: hypothetical protein PK467_14100, partial [Candidatus Wallbacteria bacterium]|nr:hypothetical protein [Candidatus Wallbacteria bacterium]